MTQATRTTAPSAARWPSRSAAAAAGRSPASRRRAALPAPGPEIAARSRAAACPAVSDARQTTTPPVSLNFAGVSHGVRSGAASSSRCGRPASERDQARKLGIAGHRAQPLVGAPLETVAEKRAIALAGNDVATSALPVQGRNSVVAEHRQRRRHDRGRPDRTQHALTPQMDEITGRDDHGQPRQHQRDAGAADDTVKIEQARDQAAGQRRRDGEEIDEVARQRIDRRPVDDRRFFRIAAEPAGVEHDQQDDAGHRQQQAAEQPGPVRRPAAQARRSPAMAATPACRRGSARSDRATPARRSRAARTADRTTSACAGRARSRAQIRRPAAAGRSRRRSSAAAGRLRSTMRTRRCGGPGRSAARNAAAAAPIAAAPAPAGRIRGRAN